MPAGDGHDCPELWYCRRDNLCWITDDPDAGLMGDGGGTSVVDAGPDAARDTGPHCVSETCNGADDDCDGLIDEGVMTVGSSVVATSGLTDDGARMVSVDTGFALVLGADANPSSWTSVFIDDAGATTTPATPLGADLDRTSDGPFAIARAGSHVFVASYLDDTHSALFALDASTGARVSGGLLMLSAPTGFGLPYLFQFGEVHPDRVSLYGLFASATGATFSIRRTIVSFAGGTPTILADGEVATDADGTWAWNVLDTASGEILVYPNVSNQCTIWIEPHWGTSATAHFIGAFTGGCSMAMDIRDRTMPISGLNPLGIAWAGLNLPLTFVEVTDVSGPAIGTPVALADSNGTYRGFDVPNEMAANRRNIELALHNGRIRLAERANDMGVVTRAIGCE